MNRKATFVLPADLLERIKAAVRVGQADSASALVRESLESRLRELREEQLAREFEEAARDPMFMEDLEECQVAFACAESDGLGGDE